MKNFIKIAKIIAIFIFSLNSNASINVGRTIANFIPNEGLSPVINRPEGIYHSLIKEDNKGILKSVKKQLTKWEQKEEYLTNWNLESFGSYNVPNTDEKKKFLDKQFIKYLDKRLSGEIKRAEEGTTLHRVGQIQQALKPSATVKVGKNVKIRFKAKLLQGFGTISLNSTYLQYTTEVDRRGSVNMRAENKLKSLGINTYANYNLNESSWEAAFEKKLPHNMVAKISSGQSDRQMAFSSDSNKIFQLGYNKAF